MPRLLTNRATIVREVPPADWAGVVEHLVRTGGPLSPFQRGWHAGLPHQSGEYRLLAAYQGDDVVGGLVVTEFSSSVAFMPPILEARRIEGHAEPEVRIALVQHLLRHVGRYRRIHLSFVSGTRHADIVAAPLRAALETWGFRPILRRAPKLTRLLDLASEVDPDLPAWRGVRRPARAMSKYPIELRTITDEACADRMRALKHETYARHGGTMPVIDFPALIAAARRHSSALHLIGCFRTDISGPDALIGWEFATCDGATGTSEHGARATTRIDGHALPCGYWTLLDCIRWSRAHGATHFDLGGVTPDDAPDFDLMRGINEFKARFGGQVVAGLELEFVKRSGIDRAVSWRRR